MAITSYKCPGCGTEDVSHAKEYDGALGYEAVVCTECGGYCDDMGEYPACDWSLEFVGKKNDIIFGNNS